ncbi:YdbL family protein [Sulfuriflexus mobilis]|uniref:YdbL family protein n=1 Tax=Sulfuriflexus mobilis TaxID=1811807 RepID=UPI000F827B81|nr:YdbL family protein [Sulfuriflexus mobilis]
MKRTLTIHLLTLLLSLSAFSMAAWSTQAWALDLQAAKAQGLVGEQLDGYLGVVKASAAVQALVQQVNDGRRTYYEGIARRNGTSVQVVEVLAGKKAIELTPPGQYVQSPSGAWTRK